MARTPHDRDAGRPGRRAPRGTLYRHIRDKDDLLDEVVDRLLAPAWRPAAAEDGWQAWVIEAATKLRHLLVTQPAALHVYLRHPVVSPAAIERMEAMMDVLRQAGADEQTARRAYGAVHTYTIGFAALEVSRARGTSGNTDASDLARQLAAYTTAGQFTDGLRYLLDGIGKHTGTGLAPERQPRMRRHSSIARGDSETWAFFTPGQRFTIWADAVVGDTIRACGLVGYGAIARSVSSPALRAPRDEAAASPARPARAPMPGGSGYAVRSVIAVSAGCAAKRRGRAGRTTTSGSPALRKGYGADRESAAPVRKIKSIIQNGRG